MEEDPFAEIKENTSQDENYDFDSADQALDNLGKMRGRLFNKSMQHHYS